MRKLAMLTLMGAVAYAPSARGHNVLAINTAVPDATSPVGFTIDGNISRTLWNESRFPLEYFVNPTDPTPGTPLLVAPGRDPAREFRIAMTRSFSHWSADEIDTTSATTEFQGETMIPAGPVDGINVVGYAASCPPGVLAFNNTIIFGVLSTVPGSPFLTFALPDPPIQFNFFGRTEQTGEILESDTAICPNMPFSTTLGDRITSPGTFDLESSATHEQGHFLGLGHSGLLASTMFSFGGPVEGDASDGKGATPIPDDRMGISTAYPSGRFEPEASLTGDVTIGSLFSALPTPAPFIGLPLAPGDPAGGVHLIAVDEDGLVQASTFSNFDGTFAIPGLRSAGRMFTVEVDSLNGPTTIANLGFQHKLLLSTLAFVDNQQVAVDMADAVPISITVENALPSAGGAIGIGGFVPLAANLTGIGVIADVAGTPGVEINGETGGGGLVVRRGELVGGVVPTPIPTVFQGDLWIFNAGAGGGAAVVSLDLGPGIFVVRGPGVAGGFYVVSAEVAPNAKRGIRNVSIVDTNGARSVLPGAITVE